MRKIILDLRTISDRAALYDRVEEAFLFPDYFGRNLDALFDCLTEITEDTCIGLFLPEETADTEEPVDPDDFTGYLFRLRQTFLDAEEENPHLCVICNL